MDPDTELRKFKAGSGSGINHSGSTTLWVCTVKEKADLPSLTDQLGDSARVDHPMILQLLLRSAGLLADVTREHRRSSRQQRINRLWVWQHYRKRVNATTLTQLWVWQPCLFIAQVAGSHKQV